jgi:hypothetical protein
LQFDLKPLAGESKEEFQARWRARQLDDPQLAVLRAQGEETAQRRAAGDEAAPTDDVAVAAGDEAAGAGAVRGELGPDGLLYVRVGDDAHWRLAVPDGCYSEVLSQMHAGVDGAHWSARRLLATLRRWFW